MAPTFFKKRVTTFFHLLPPTPASAGRLSGPTLLARGALGMAGMHRGGWRQGAHETQGRGMRGAACKVHMHGLARWHRMRGGSTGEQGELGFVCGVKRK